MNKIHRIIWSAVHQTWVAASEISRGRGKSSSSRKGIVGGVATALLTALPLHGHAAPAPDALPTGAQVVSGQVGITQAGGRMTINQATNQAILNWSSFNIGANSSVNFLQPSINAVVLNRVTGSDPSAIYGTLSASGQVFLVNPNGVLFGQSARADVGGLVASTLNIRNEDFLAGNYRLTRDGATAGVTNQGELLGKYVALLAPEVRNSGIITAHQGTVALAAGEAVTLSLTGNNLIDVQVDKASIDTLIENKHLVQADAGMVILSAQSAHQLLGQVVNSGILEASGISSDGGVIRLRASSGITHTGSARADAGENGQGGTITAIADLTNPNSQTTVNGSVSAKGGSQTGNGGFIETSGSHLKIADTAQINTTAAHGQAGQWLLDPVDFTIAATNGDISGAALATALGTNSVTIQTASTGTNTATIKYGASGFTGDIFVNDSVSWSANTLTLNAGNNIAINAPISATGTAGLALKYGQAAVNANNTATYSVNAPVNIANTGSFSTQLGNNVAATTYTVVTSEAALIAIGNAMAGNYVLGSNLTAATNPWAPLGNAAGNLNSGALVTFTGTLDGLGHTINGLTRANTADSTGVGLFGEIGTGGKVQNLGLTNVNLAGLGSVGALSGINGGTIINVYATGSITGSRVVPGSTSVVGSIGGLIGQNNSNISKSYANVAVTATTAGTQTQGAGADGGIGGLVGVHNNGSITTSYAAGSVSGIVDVGGLVGYANAGITSSYARGAVTGTTNVGGFLGQAGMVIANGQGLLANTYWDTTTSGQATSASTTGFMATNSSTGLTTAAMKVQANVSNLDFVRDWVMYDNVSYPLLRSMLTPLIITAANKSMTYNGNTYNAGYSNTYSLAAPDATQYTGAITYGGAGGTGTTAVNVGTYAITPSGLTLTNAAMANQHGYLISYVDGSLTINQAPVTTLNLSGSRVYDGTNIVNANIFTLGGLVGGQTLTLTGSGTVPTKNVGSQTVTLNTLALANGTGVNAGLASNYTLTGGTHTATITSKDLAVTGLTASNKIYDALPGAILTGTAAITPLTGDVVTLGGTPTGSFANKNVGTGKAVTVTGSSISGTDAGNYNLVQPAGLTANITPKDLAVTGLTASNKIYDALTGATLTGTAAITPLTGDVVTLGGTPTGSFANKNVGTGKAVTVTGSTLSGTDAGNYNLVQPAGLTANITPKDLAVTGLSASNKIYDALTGATLDSTVAAVTPLTGDVVTLGGTPTGSFANKNVGTGKAVTVTGSTLSGTDAGNYNLVQPAGLTANITPKPLTVTATGKNKEYDGLTTATVTLTDLGRMAGDVLAVSNSAATFTDMNAGTGKTVNVTGISIVGPDAGNYTLSSTTATTTADITFNPETATVAATTVSNIGQISGGKGTVSVGVSGTTTTLTQQGNHLLLDWTSFGIPSTQTLTFSQPASTAVAVNRITDTNPTQLFGKLTANGIVFLINPSGIVFNPTASIDVGGLVASALSVKGFESSVTPANVVWADKDSQVFNAARLSFTGTGGTLNNQANLSLGADKFWGFYGNQVVNDGSITVAGGTGTHADSWKDANTLMLSSQNNITLNATLDIQGNGKLLLETGQGAVAAGNTGDYLVKAPVNLAAPSSFNTRSGSDGALTAYTVLTDLAGLRGMAAGTNYALGANIDASDTKTTAFLAVRRDHDTLLAGLGHTINDLKGNGFITALDNKGMVRDIGMVNVAISGSFNVGGLVGWLNNGTISNSYASGSIMGSSYHVGGLVGYQYSGTISNSYASGSVRGSSKVGGLVGYQSDGTISNSYASGSVTGSFSDVGGLVGYQYKGTISNSYASGSVRGSSKVGGLVGYQKGTGTSSNSLALTATEAKIQAKHAGFDFTTVWAIDEGQSAPYLRGLPRPAATTITGSSVRDDATDQKVYNSVASVLSAALASNSQTKTRGGESVSSLASGTTKLLETVRGSNAATPSNTSAVSGSQTPIQSTTGTSTQTPQQAMAQAITQMKQIVAAQCSSCSFSDADYQAWVTGGKTIPPANTTTPAPLTGTTPLTPTAVTPSTPQAAPLYTTTPIARPDAPPPATEPPVAPPPAVTAPPLTGTVEPPRASEQAAKLMQENLGRRPQFMGPD